MRGGGRGEEEAGSAETSENKGSNRFSGMTARRPPRTTVSAVWVSEYRGYGSSLLDWAMAFRVVLCGGGRGQCKVGSGKRAVRALEERALTATGEVLTKVGRLVLVWVRTIGMIQLIIFFSSG